MSDWSAAPSGADWYGNVVVQMPDGETDYFDGYSEDDEPDVTELAPEGSIVLESRLEATPQGRFFEAPECEACDGDEQIECEHCNGVGVIEQDCDNCTDGFVESHDAGEECADPVNHAECYESCDECDGSGNIRPDCADCSGSGKLDCAECV